MLKINYNNYKTENFITEAQAIKIIRKFQKRGKIVGLSTGSFDLLHPGHISHLLAAKKLCDILIVAVARDKNSSKKFPNSGRPIFPDKIRAFMIANLKCPDYVILDNGTQSRTIPKLRPNLYIKGIDYSNLKDKDILKEKALMESFGGKIVFTNTEKLATTEILVYIKEKIKDIRGQKKIEIY